MGKENILMTITEKNTNDEQSERHFLEINF